MGACDHVVGRAYWGQFCVARQEELKVDHVALVDAPADKRCRVTHFDVEGGRRNRMTWKIAPRDNDDVTAAQIT